MINRVPYTIVSHLTSLKSIRSALAFQRFAICSMCIKLVFTDLYLVPGIA